MRSYCSVVVFVFFQAACLAFDITQFNARSNNVRSDTSDLIFPGTKWCGAGSIAENYDDLGTEAQTDMCCRDHDHCSEYIMAKQSLHGLKNNAAFTRVHCRCDQQFYECLKTQTAKGVQASAMVGYMYFNMLETQCFKEEYPIINCTTYPKSKRCSYYYLDATAPAKYQWFDVPRYM